MNEVALHGLQSVQRLGSRLETDIGVMKPRVRRIMTPLRVSLDSSDP
jgi:hypothetical protein